MADDVDGGCGKGGDGVLDWDGGWVDEGERVSVSVDFFAWLPKEGACVTMFDRMDEGFTRECICAHVGVE